MIISSNKIKSVFFAAILLVFTASCVETIVVGSTAGGVIAVREKSISSTQKDVVIATRLGTDFLINGLKAPGSSVDITVNEGRVLLTGIVRDEVKAESATELAWKIPGVKEVIDEIQLHDSGISLKDTGVALVDYGITAEVEGRLLFASNIAWVNFKITTVNKTVYLLGVAQNSEEMRRVLSTISKVRGVKKVVNHVILIDDKRRNG